MKPALVVVGTRPEAIKLAPLVKELCDRGYWVDVLVTGQHDMGQVLPVLQTMGIPESLVSFSPYENIEGVTESIGRLIDSVSTEVAMREPGVIIVQGDTASTFAGALAGFLRGVPVAHVEAGLRTHDLSHPFPEEGFRQAVARWAAVHLAPTEAAADHLRRENVFHSDYRVTGNTGVDSLRIVSETLGRLTVLDRIVFTLHRRESWGEGMRAILRNVRRAMDSFPNTEFLIVRHPNPAVGEEVQRHLSNASNATVVPPLEYPEMVAALLQSRGILTDSGGLQEEALALGVPTLVMRQRTERPELLHEGKGALVGNEGGGIEAGLQRILTEPLPIANVFRSTIIGDGFASRRVVDALEEKNLLSTWHQHDGTNAPATIVVA